MPKVAIIILNWKQPTLTLETLKSFLNIDSSNFTYHIYLVNNNHSDESYELLSKEFLSHPNITIVNTGSNLGFAQGNNFGLTLAMKEKFDYYLLANNDILVKPDFLKILVKQIQQLPQAGLVSPKIYFAPGFEFHKNRYTDNDKGKVIWSAGGKIDWNNVEGSNIGIDEVDKGQYDCVTEPDFLSGCCLLIKNEVLAKVGLLENKYFMYLEDADFCQRVKKAGFRGYFIPQSIIWHINSGSSKPGSDIHNYFLTRNRLIFAFRHASFRTNFAVLRQSVKVLFSDPSIWRRRAVIDFIIGKSGKGSWK